MPRSSHADTATNREDTKMRGIHPCWIVAVAPSSLFHASTALAQAGVQVAPDGVIVISKDVGEERWSIVYDAERGTAIGNVFFSDWVSEQFPNAEVRAVFDAASSPRPKISSGRKEQGGARRGHLDRVGRARPFALERYSSLYA